MKQFGQGSKSRAWAQKAKSSAMQDRANGIVDGDRYQAPTYTLDEISALFEGSRLGALVLGELHGEPMLPRDHDNVAAAQLVGIVERDRPMSELIEIGDGFSVTRADFASGDWVFVMADTVAAEIYKLKFR